MYPIRRRQQYNPNEGNINPVIPMGKRSNYRYWLMILGVIIDGRQN